MKKGSDWYIFTNAESGLFALSIFRTGDSEQESTHPGGMMWKSPSCLTEQTKSNNIKNKLYEAMTQSMEEVTV